MKTKFKSYLTQCVVLLLVISIFTGCSTLSKTSTSLYHQPTSTSFDSNWHFKLMPYGTDDSGMNLQNPSLDDSSWRSLNLPHDWAIEGGFQIGLPNNTGKLPYSGVAWYRKQFTIPAGDSGKRIFVDFDGAMSHAKVWLNGEYIGQWPYGYSSFRLELTPHVKFGKQNLIVVRLNNPDNSARWYPGGGIYRHTWLVKTNPIHVTHWGTYVTTPKVSDESATVKIQTEVHNQSDTDSIITVQHEIAHADKPDKIITISEPKRLKIPVQKVKLTTAAVTIKNPERWDIENPNLYIVHTTITTDGKTLDTYQTRMALPSISPSLRWGYVLSSFFRN